MDSSQEWQYVIFCKAPLWFKNAMLSSELQQDCTPNSKTRVPTVTTNFHASMLQDRRQLWLMPSHSLTEHLLYAKPSAGFWYGQRGIGCDSCAQRTPPQKVRWTRKPRHQRWTSPGITGCSRLIYPEDNSCHWFSLYNILLSYDPSGNGPVLAHGKWGPIYV